MFGNAGALIKRGLTSERLYIASLLDRIPVGPIIAIILDYATIDPRIVDAMSIKANKVTTRHIDVYDEIVHTYSIRRYGDPVLERVVHRSGRLHSKDFFSGVNALMYVIDGRCADDMRLYSALMRGYANTSSSAAIVKYDSESD